MKYINIMREAAIRSYWTWLPYLATAGLLAWFLLLLLPVIQAVMVGAAALWESLTETFGALKADIFGFWLLFKPSVWRQRRDA